jgi:exoribonuclease R
MYKFLNNSKAYDNFKIVETKTFNEVVLSCLSRPIKTYKLFNNDTFDFDENVKAVRLVHSPTRQSKHIPGILDLSTTHGKMKGRFLYICKPDDKRLPFFLVPYQVPYKFDKSTKRLYVTFQFSKWDDTDKAPYGILVQNLGDTIVLSNYYEYILYCKSLNISIQQFTKESKQIIKRSQLSCDELIQTIAMHYNIECVHKSQSYIFTIDPYGSNDYDDALSYDIKERKLSIYITNVAIVLDYLNLWNAFSKRVSSIYLPDQKRSMLPGIITDSLCSLKEKHYKLCYKLDVYYDENGNIIENIIGLCYAYISKNYYYEKEDEFMQRKDIQKLSTLLNCKHSKDIVTKCMLYFNEYIALYLKKKSCGIFKSLKQTDILCEDNKPSNLPQNVIDFINITKNNSSRYISYPKRQDKTTPCPIEEDDNDDLGISYQSLTHKHIGAYIQATSPIRRIVDLLNNIAIQDCISYENNQHSMKLSKGSSNFYNWWTEQKQMEYINTSMRAIRKIQSKCKIYALHEYNKSRNIPITYEGYLYDRIKKVSDGKYQYMVYLPKLQLATYVTLLEEYDNYSQHNFTLHVFMSEENDKKKIKLQIIRSD